MRPFCVRLARATTLLGIACLLGVANAAAPAPADARLTLSQLLQERPLDQLYHTGWAAREGFQGPVMGLAQTTDGYLWVGTAQGLFRFDGVRFERFETLAGETLQSKSVMSLFATPDNGLWVGFLSGGAAFVRAGHVLSTEPAKTSFGGSTRAFGREKDGTMWVANSRGVFRREGDRWREMGKAEGYPEIGPGQYTEDMRLDGDGNVWAFTTRALMVRPAGQSRFVEAPTNGQHARQPAVDPQGRIWARVGDRYVRLPRPGVPGDVLGAGRPATSSLFMPMFDREGNLWYGALDGVVRERVPGLAPDSGEAMPAAAPPVPLVPLTPASGPSAHGAGQSFDFGAPALQRLTAAHGLTGDRVVKVFQDREGSIWLGTNGGLDRLRPTRVPTFQFPVRTSELAMARGTRGDAWFTSHSGLLHLNAPGEGADLELFPSASVSMSAVLVDHAGTVWVGSAEGLHRLAPDGHYVDELKPTFPDWNGAVTDLIEDASGRIWLMAQAFGPLRRAADGHWERLAGQKGFPNAIFNCMAADSQGRVWMGTVGNRLLRVETGDRVTRLNEKDGVDVGDLLSLTPGKGYLWIGGERGVQRMDDSGAFHTLKAASPDALNGISGLVETPEGDLWLNGEAGITRILAADVRRAMADPGYRVPLLQLGTLDGLPGRAETVFPLRTALRTPDGRLWFSLTNALVTVDPATLTSTIGPPGLDVQRVIANGAPLPPGPGGLVHAAAGTRELQVDYAALSLAVPERARFQYRLRGLEADWHDAGARRQAFYTNLGPGRYDFEVRATNDGVAWSDKPATLAIEIPPTFVQSLVFKVLCGVLLVAAAALLVRMRLRQLEARALAQYRVRLEERTRIAQDLHDTLLQGFQGLLLRFQRVSRLIDEPRARVELERVMTQADEVVIEGRDRVADLRASPPDAGPLEQTLEAQGRDLSGYHDSAFRLHVEGPSRALEPTARTELALVAREALFNAFQHSRAALIEMTLRYTDAAFELQLKDDGVGLPPDTLAQGRSAGHWGLSGMRERMERLGGRFELRSAAGEGTIVLLALPASRAFGRPGKPGAFEGIRGRAEDLLQRMLARQALD